jgi:hypothetical protein
METATLRVKPTAQGSNNSAPTPTPDTDTIFIDNKAPMSMTTVFNDSKRERIFLGSAFVTAELCTHLPASSRYSLKLQNIFTARQHLAE